MAAVPLGYVLSHKKEIGRRYTIATSNRTLFLHFFASLLILDVAACVLSCLFGFLVLDPLSYALLRSMADPYHVEALMGSYSFSGELFWSTLGKRAAILLAISFLGALIGSRRKYYFEYREGE